jgi:hypothetical protein
VGLSFDIVGGSLEWGMLPVLDDTDQILSNHRERSGSKKLHDAKQFLRDQLEGKQPVDSERIIRLAEERGLSRNKLLDAKRDLCIEARKTGFSGKWVWSFPSDQGGSHSLIPT